MTDNMTDDIMESLPGEENPEETPQVPEGEHRMVVVKVEPKEGTSKKDGTPWKQHSFTLRPEDPELSKCDPVYFSIFMPTEDEKAAAANGDLEASKRIERTLQDIWALRQTLGMKPGKSVPLSAYVNQSGLFKVKANGKNPDLRDARPPRFKKA